MLSLAVPRENGGVVTNAYWGIGLFQSLTVTLSRNFFVPATYGPWGNVIPVPNSPWGNVIPVPDSPWGNVIPVPDSPWGKNVIPVPDSPGVGGGGGGRYPSP